MSTSYEKKAPPYMDRLQKEHCSIYSNVLVVLLFPEIHQFFETLFLGHFFSFFFFSSEYSAPFEDVPYTEEPFSHNW